MSALIKLKLIGSFSVDSGGNKIVKFRSRRVPALLAFLAMNGGQRRADIMAALWPDIEMPEVARHNLRQTLLYCRQAFGFQPIEAKGEYLELADGITTDIDEMTYDTHEVALVKNGFLADFRESWAFDAKSQVMDRILTNLCEQAEALLDEDPNAALILADAAIVADPFSEVARVLRIECLVALDRRSEAKSEEVSFTHFLKRELGLEPSAALSSALEHPIQKTHDQSSKREIESFIQFIVSNHDCQLAETIAEQLCPFFIANGEETRGIQIINSLLSLSTVNLASNKSAKLFLALSRLHASRGELLVALRNGEIAHRIGRGSTLEIDIHLQLGKLHVRRFEFKIARQHLECAERLSIEQNRESEHYQSRILRAALLFSEGKYPLCEKVSNAAISIAKERGDWKNELYLEQLLVSSRVRLGKDVRNAIQTTGKKIDSYAKKGHRRSLLERMNLGRSLEEIGELDLARRAYEAGVVCSREDGDNFGLAVSLTYLGDLHERLGNYEQAIGSHQEALRLRGPLGDEIGIACSYRGIGRAHLSQGDHIKSRNALVKSLQMFQSMRDSCGYCSSCLLLTLTELELGHDQVAHRIGKRSLEILPRLGEGADQIMGPTFSTIIAKVQTLTQGL